MNYFNQESERLTYRKLTLSDITSWLEFFENNDRVHFLGIDPTRPHLEVATEWIEKQLDRYITDGLGLLAVIHKDSNDFIGMCGIIPRGLEKGKFHEIGYSFKPKYWGKGYATEAANQMRKFGQTNNVSEKFISIININNIDSIKVADKNKMKPLYNTRYLEMDVVIYST